MVGEGADPFLLLLQALVTEPEDLLVCGAVEFYDRTYDCVTPRSERRLERWREVEGSGRAEAVVACYCGAQACFCKARRGGGLGRRGARRPPMAAGEEDDGAGGSHCAGVSEK